MIIIISNYKNMEKTDKESIKKQNNQNLNQETIQEIKNSLLEEKENIKKELQKISKKDFHEVDNRSAKFPEYGDKPDENAQEINDYSTRYTTQKLLEKNLEDINKSLKKIEEGDYGICKYCQNNISKKRLLARPTTTACIECKKNLQNS